MTGPTPADVYGRGRAPLARRAPAGSDPMVSTVAGEPIIAVDEPVIDATPMPWPSSFFASHYRRDGRTPPSAWRARARDEAITAAEDLARELVRLRRRDESDLDLRIESYRRAADRLDDALDAFDDALADPAGPPVPTPTARDL